MNTVLELFDGVELIRPAHEAFCWPHPTFSGFPECCGIGEAASFANKIIPETILGMEVGPACCVHDWMQTLSAKTWQGFHYSNSVFLCNLLEINECRGGNALLRRIRKPIILRWFVAVSSPIGARNFFDRG